MTRLLKATMAIAMLAAGAGHAAEPAYTCDNFTVYIELADVAFMDVGDEGVSAGDRRVGSYRTVDADGEQVGSFYFESTVLPGGEDGKRQAIANAIHDLADGSVSISMLYDLKDPSDTATGAVSEFTYPVTGGTGVFTGARGTVRSSTDDQGRRAQIFELSCPG